MKITVLMENSARDGLIPEHGLSFYIEYRGGRYLLDAGECGAVVYNAARLGVDLSQVDKAALSHGHYDHADGPRDLAAGLHLIPDRVKHEQSLVAETSEGLVVLNSCCHAGVVKILTQLSQQFPGTPIRAVLGGFHLMGKEGVSTLGPVPEKVRAMAAALRDDLKVQDIYTGHCTGGPAYALLEEELGDRLHHLTAGAVYQFAD